jgi:hypothetical protein
MQILTHVLTDYSDVLKSRCESRSKLEIRLHVLSKVLGFIESDTMLPCFEKLKFPILMIFQNRTI